MVSISTSVAEFSFVATFAVVVGGGDGVVADVDGSGDDDGVVGEVVAVGNDAVVVGDRTGVVTDEVACIAILTAVLVGVISV